MSKPDIKCAWCGLPFPATERNRPQYHDDGRTACPGLAENYEARMTLQDLNQFAKWWQARASLAEVEAVPRFGLVDNERFTPAAVRAYRLAWEWSAIRLESAHQNRVYARHGAAFVDRRIARASALVARIVKGA